MEVRYPRFREYERQRVTTNDTMMGLLAGSKLASQTLTLTAGSKLSLSQIFPQVPHIQRFNLTTERAQEILSNAEGLLGILAVPQIMALHEDLMTGMLEMVETSHPQLGRLSKDAKNATIHETFQTATKSNFSAKSLELFHLVRLARNAHIHNGGIVGQYLADRVAQCDSATLETWKKITRTTFPLCHRGDKVHLGLSELIGILALTKRLAREANEALQHVLPSAVWADLVVEDWLNDRKAGNSAQQLKRLRGLANMHYQAVAIPDRELVAAQARAATP